MTEALYATLPDLEAGLQEMGQHDAAYWDKQVHKVPVVPSVDRVSWLLHRLAGKIILHIGCAGPLHGRLRKSCKRAYGIDLEPSRLPDYWALDVEKMGCALPPIEQLETVLLAEVLEHLLAPGFLLQKVRAAYPNAEVIITTPNAGARGLQASLKQGYENVNRDHTCWFSWRTLTTLVEKCGYTVREWYWYSGEPLTAEGLIFVVEQDGSPIMPRK